MRYDFYEQLPFLGPVAEWLAKAHAYAKSKSKEGGKPSEQYKGYIVLDDEGQLTAYALMRLDILKELDERHSRWMANEFSAIESYKESHRRGNRVELELRNPPETIAGEFREQVDDGVYVYVGFERQRELRFYSVERVVGIHNLG